MQKRSIFSKCLYCFIVLSISFTCKEAKSQELSSLYSRLSQLYVIAAVANGPVEKPLINPVSTPQKRIAKPKPLSSPTPSGTVPTNQVVIPPLPSPVLAPPDVVPRVPVQPELP